MFSFVLFAILSCNDEKKDAPATDAAAAVNTDTPAGLPYTATYTSNWSTNVSDADLKTVLPVSYTHLPRFLYNNLHG